MCRRGISANKPQCDEAYRRINFKTKEKRLKPSGVQWLDNHSSTAYTSNLPNRNLLDVFIQNDPTYRRMLKGQSSLGLLLLTCPKQHLVCSISRLVFAFLSVASYSHFCEIHMVGGGNGFLCHNNNSCGHWHDALHHEISSLSMDRSHDRNCG